MPTRSSPPNPTAHRRVVLRRAAVVVTAAVAVLTSCGDDDAAAADPARFCEIDAEIGGLDDFTTATPERARELIGRTRDLLAEAEEVAPDEISAEVSATAESYREILDYYADADFDVDPEAFEAALASGEIGTDPPEAEVVFGWLDENCAGP